MDLSAGLRRLVFVLLCAAIVGIGSERMFWYWSSNPLDHYVVALVYAPAVAGSLWLVDHYRVHDRWGLLLVAPVIGLLVEGVITPIVYTGGPFVPFFPVWFGAWHGLLSLVVLLFAFRLWLVSANWRRLLVASAGLGLFWGTWSTTMWLPENLDDPELIADLGGPLRILDPTEFTAYVFSFAAILAGAHLALGAGLWVSSFRPAAATRWVWIAATAAAVVAWTFAIPWAAPMFAAYLALQLWGLQRSERVTDRPSLLARLDGTFPATRLLPILAMPIVASATYATWWAIDPADDVVRGVFMYGTIAVQTLVGAVLFTRALRQAVRPTTGSETGGDGVVEGDRARGPGDAAADHHDVLPLDRRSSMTSVGGRRLATRGARLPGWPPT